MSMRNEGKRSTSRVVRRAAGVVVLMLLFTCVCSVGFVSLSGVSVGVETRDMEVSLRRLENGRSGQMGPSPLLIDLTGAASAGAVTRSCTGSAIPLGSAELSFMECTTVITP